MNIYDWNSYYVFVYNGTYESEAKRELIITPNSINRNAIWIRARKCSMTDSITSSELVFGLLFASFFMCLFHSDAWSKPIEHELHSNVMWKQISPASAVIIRVKMFYFHIAFLRAAFFGRPALRDIWLFGSVLQWVYEMLWNLRVLLKNWNYLMQNEPNGWKALRILIVCFVFF